MKNKHIFSASYENRKSKVLTALRREESICQEMRSRWNSRIPVKALAAVAILSVLSISIYAAAQLIDFRMIKNGDEVHIHAGLNSENNISQDRPLRSWRAEDGEISIKLNIPNMPSDLTEDLTAAGKYGSADSSRSLTINGIDLRRSDLDQIVGGATDVKQISSDGMEMYVINRGEANYYDRIAYVVYEADELVLKLWVSYGITDDELISIASNMTIEYTSDTLLAIPIMNELGDNSGSTDIFYRDNETVHDYNMASVGESVRNKNDWFTVTVNNVESYDNISVLNQNNILRWDFVNRFIDENGNLIPYNRTEIIWSGDVFSPTKNFGESTLVKKKLYVVTLTMSDINMSEFEESDRDEMLTACVNGFELDGYTVNNGTVEMKSMDAVVDRKPDAYADGSFMVYREYLGDNRWKVAYLIDEDIADGNLVLSEYTGNIYVKIQ